MRVRDSALASGFGTWAPAKGEVGSSVYTGMNFWGEHAPMIKGLHQCLGVLVYPNSMFFRVCNEDTEGAYVHSDRESGDYTAIVYLSDHERQGSGTAFYRHIETGMESMPTFRQLAQDQPFFERFKTEMTEGRPQHWHMRKFVPGRFNRAVIFDAPLFHSRQPRHGFGSTPEDGRLVWACHFNL